MNAYDIVFEREDVWYFEPTGTSPVDGAVNLAGWMGTVGPQLGNAWPRGSRTGLPMAHVMTLRLPEDYRVKGDEYVAIAFFQGEAEIDDVPQLDSASRFSVQLKEATEHPMCERLTDLIGGEFALIWLTQDEYAAGPGVPPEDVRASGERDDPTWIPNAWDTPTEFCRLGLVLRDDPNAGRAPTEDETEGGYEGLYDQDGELHEWADRLYGRCHLGGTAFPVQGLPEGLSATYFELEEFGPMNLGGGVLQCDLTNGTFDWACG